MNLLPARLTELYLHQGVSLMRFEALGEELTMVGLEPPREAAEGSRVTLGVKATHLILSRSRPETAGLCNALPVRCGPVTRGEILASVALECRGRALEAILPRESLERLDPKEGEKLYALFQAAELSIVEVGDES